MNFDDINLKIVDESGIVTVIINYTLCETNFDCRKLYKEDPREYLLIAAISLVDEEGSEYQQSGRGSAAGTVNSIEQQWQFSAAVTIR